MIPAILSIGTQLPPHTLSQMEIANYLNKLLHLSDEEAWFIEKIYKNSAISQRYSVLPDVVHSNFPSETIEFLGMTQRNSIYKQEAPSLALKAVKNALDQWKRPLNEITHVISVSCTGVMTPGIEFILAKQLGLEPDTSLLGINFMGCHGAFKALKVATKIARDHPRNRVLLVCTELCTLHFKPRGDIESVVIQSLFADGSAAVVIGAQPIENEVAIFEFVHEQCFAIQDSLEDMTWDASTEGFDMTLSQRVPGLIGKHIETFAKRLVGSSNFEECEWAIHPGGKAIIESVEKALAINRSLTQSTWNVLSQCGNLSSATILYVLKDISQRQTLKKTVASLGFGPGLSVEGLLLKKPA